MKKIFDGSIDFGKVLELCGKFLNSLSPRGKVVVVATTSAAVTAVALPAACKSLTKFAYEFPAMAESINEGLNTLKQGSSNLIANVVAETQTVDEEAAA